MSEETSLSPVVYAFVGVVAAGIVSCAYVQSRGRKWNVKDGDDSDDEYDQQDDHGHHVDDHAAVDDGEHINADPATAAVDSNQEQGGIGIFNNNSSNINNNNDNINNNMVTTDRRLAAVDDIAVVNEATQRQLEDEAVFRQALRRSQYFFPGLNMPDGWNPPRYKYNQQSPMVELKSEIVSRINQRLKAMDSATRKRLMMRVNAEECCLALGMNVAVVQLKFEAQRGFEKELGITGKTPILHSISHLIGTLNANNPYGEVNNRIVDGYRGKEWRSYMGVEAKPENLDRVIEMVQNALDEMGLGDAFMRGTTASRLQTINANDGDANRNEKQPMARHDFGPGVYCFKGHLVRSLSFAFDRSWPQPKLDESSWEERLDIEQITRDNPAIVVFPKAGIPINGRFFHVGVNPYPYDDAELSEMLEPSYEEYKEKQQQWEHIKTPELREWMHFVKIARFFEEVPESHVFYGLLHDCDTVAETKSCAQPRPDEDGWDQYCFTKGNKYLRKERLFVEFFIDWKEWVGKKPNRKEISECLEDLDTRLTTLDSNE